MGLGVCALNTEGGGVGSTVAIGHEVWACKEVMGCLCVAAGLTCGGAMPAIREGQGVCVEGASNVLQAGTGRCPVPDKRATRGMGRPRAQCSARTRGLTHVA